MEKPFALKAREQIFLPLTSQPICGHDISEMGMRGHEEEMFRYRGKKVDYLAVIETGPCPICNKRQEKRLTALAKRTERKAQ